MYAPLPQQLPSQQGPNNGQGQVLLADPPFLLPSTANVVPDEGAVARLTQMGFAEVDVRRVLVSSNNNLAIATTRLLEQR